MKRSTFLIAALLVVGTQISRAGEEEIINVNQCARTIATDPIKKEVNENIQNLAQFVLYSEYFNTELRKSICYNDQGFIPDLALHKRGCIIGDKNSEDKPF